MLASFPAAVIQRLRMTAEGKHTIFRRCKIFKLIIPIFISLQLLALTFVLPRADQRFQALEGFTDQEKMVLRQQLTALPWVSVGWLVVWVLFYFYGGLKRSFPLWGLDLSFLDVCLLLWYLGFGYIALSAIKNKVCFLSGKGQETPLKGWAAVAGGVFMLIMMSILTTVFLFTEAGDMLNVFFE